MQIKQIPSAEAFKIFDKQLGNEHGSSLYTRNTLDLLITLKTNTPSE